MTPLEFIFLGLLGGAFLVALGAFFYFLVTSILKLSKSVESLIAAVKPLIEKGTIVDGMNAVKMLSGGMPVLVEGMSGLCRVMGVFNKVMVDRDNTTREQTGRALFAGSGEDGESSFDAYDEEAQVQLEHQRELRKAGIRAGTRDTRDTRPPSREQMVEAGNVPPIETAPSVVPENLAVPEKPSAVQQ